MKSNIIKSLGFCIIFLCMLQVKAQQSLSVSLESAFTKELKTTFLNATEKLYHVNMISKIYKRFSFSVNVRMEDELTSENTYSLLNDVTFFDMKLNYQLGSFNIDMIISNLLGFNDTSFSIEPMLDKTIIDDVYFSHEANFLVSTCITYNF